MNIVIHGVCGRMGRRILALVHDDPAFTVTGAVDAPGRDEIGSDIGVINGTGECGVTVTDDLSTCIGGADCVIDFTYPAGALSAASVCGNKGIALVSGTTGLSNDQRTAFEKSVSGIPCVLAPNMSVGVNLLFTLVEQAARILGNEYDVEIMEVHHRFKKDAPSGTAKRLGEIVAETLDRSYDEEIRNGRAGMVGERTQREIGMHALRIGDVVGEHTVSFGTLGERVELVHKAQSRDALAKGALKAASFVNGAEPGLYDMQDVLGLR